MILDANGGNQTMWIYKDNKDILHIDMNKKLTVKPDIWCSNICTPFPDCTFPDIFIDPPHFYGDKGSIYSIPDMETFISKFKGYGTIPRYYGGDIYKNQTELIGYVHKLQKEMYRILKDDGLLWLKWNESMISTNTILSLFENWNIMLKLQMRLSNPNRTEKQTYWVCMCKKKIKTKQAELTLF